MARHNGRRSRTAGNRGNGSKWIRPEKRLKLYERDKFSCIWCGFRQTFRGSLCLDHIIPRESGGSNDAHNLVTSCHDCNEARGTTPAITFAYSLHPEHPELAKDVLCRLLEAVLTPLKAVSSVRE